MNLSIFEKIINNELPSYKIYDDDNFVIILDINPTSPGHSLLIPKKRNKDILSENKETLNKMFEIAQVFSKHMLLKLEATGIKWVVNTGSDAGQLVFHTHLHLIPYYNATENKNKNNINNLKDMYNSLKYKNNI